MEDFLKQREGESEFRHKVRLCVAKLDKELALSWSEIRDALGLDCSADHLRKVSYGYREMIDEETETDSPIDRDEMSEDEEYKLQQAKYKSSEELSKDGSYKSDKLLKMSEEDKKDPEFLLKAHGFDPSEWDLLNAKNNIWYVYSKKDGVQQLYSSKITAKPKVVQYDIDKLVEALKVEAQPYKAKSKVVDGKNLLEIPLYDLHFGVNTYESYQQVLEDVLETIHSKKWDTIFFIIGQDLLHNNGFNGQTSSGTLIEKVHMQKAWADAVRFYTDLITHAINQSRTVKCSFSIANHDDSMSWGLFMALSYKFPDLEFDSSTDVRKAFTWNEVFIGYTHGHKGHTRLHENFISDFGKLIAVSTISEIHTGHLHQEIAKDKFGLLVRTLSTKAKTDEWHKDNGFVGAHKRFQLFEYTPNSLKAIHFI